MTAIKGNITRIGATSFQITDGQQAYVPPAEIETKTLTLSFGVGSALSVEYLRINFDATVDLSVATTNNVATVAYYLNGSVVAGSQSVEVGDLLRVDITKTIGGNAASLSLDFEYDTATELVSVDAFTYARWTNLANMVEVDYFTDSPHSLRSSSVGNSIDFELRGAYSVQSFSGVFTIEIDFLPIYSMFGIRTTNSGAIDGGGLSYGLFNNAGDIVVREGAANPVGGAFNESQGRFASVALRIVDTGAAIEYWKKFEGGSWTLHYTSVAAYTPNETYYIALIAGVNGTRFPPIRITQQ